jgi:hypothetical protein
MYALFVAKFLAVFTFFLLFFSKLLLIFLVKFFEEKEFDSIISNK